MARKYSNTSVETTLVNSVNSSVTSIEINDTGGLPATFPYSLILDFETANVEVVTVTNLAGGTLTVTRGQDGTAAQSHNTGAVVVHGPTARDFSEPQAHIDAASEVHGLAAGSELVGTTDTQALTNKTISGSANTLTNIAGSSLAPAFNASTVDATFQSVTLSGPDPDVDVATELADLQAGLPVPGQRPGEVIGTPTVETSNSSTFTTTETQVSSITVPLVSGRTYWVEAFIGFNSTVVGDVISGRLREDNASGNIIDQNVIATVFVSGFRKTTCPLYFRFTASATANKTFVATGQRDFGTGTCRMEANTNRPSFMRVIYESG
jgi:hypothetical protein